MGIQYTIVNDSKKEFISCGDKFRAMHFLDSSVGWHLFVYKMMCCDYDSWNGDIIRIDDETEIFDDGWTDITIVTAREYYEKLPDYLAYSNCDEDALRVKKLISEMATNLEQNS